MVAIANANHQNQGAFRAEAQIPGLFLRRNPLCCMGAMLACRDTFERSVPCLSWRLRDSGHGAKTLLHSPFVYVCTGHSFQRCSWVGAGHPDRTPTLPPSFAWLWGGSGVEEVGARTGGNSRPAPSQAHRCSVLRAFRSVVSQENRGPPVRPSYPSGDSRSSHNRKARRTLGRCGWEPCSGGLPSLTKKELLCCVCS